VHAYATYGPLACTFLSSDYYDCHHAVTEHRPQHISHAKHTHTIEEFESA